MSARRYGGRFSPGLVCVLVSVLVSGLARETLVFVMGAAAREALHFGCNEVVGAAPAHRPTTFW